MPKKPLPPSTGRPRGAKNKATLLKKARAAKALQAVMDTGVSPLEVMIRRMHNPATVSDKSFAAAVAAAPYVHPKLSAVAVKQVVAPAPLDLRNATAAELAVIRKFVALGPAGVSPEEVIAAIEGTAEEIGDAG